MYGYFFRAPCRTYMDSYTNISMQIIMVHEFRTYHMCFIHKEHVKLYETHIDTQGHLKVSLSNVMDILGRLTSKFHET